MTSLDRAARVSVVIPTYNQAGLLPLTLDSVLAQTYPDVEIIVVDDGSTDHTPAVMAAYAGRVTYIREAINRGSTGSLRRGLEAATGAYVNFLDHDDLCEPSKLAEQVRVLEAHPEIGLVHCGYYLIDHDSRRLEKISFLPAGTLAELVCLNQIWSGGPLIRRALLQRPDWWDDPIWFSDWGRVLRLAQAGCKFACVQAPLGSYRILPGSQMSNVGGIEKFALRLLAKVFEEPLPPEVQATQEKAYGTTHLWLGWRYFAAGRPGDGQRHLVEALARLPELQARPEILLDSILGDALSARVADPKAFVLAVLEHLPPQVNFVRDRQAGLLARLHIGLAFRYLARNQGLEAQAEFSQALAADPLWPERSDEFAQALSHFAGKMPDGAPEKFVEHVFSHLPVSLSNLQHVQSRILSDVNLNLAFEARFAERHQQAISHFWRATRLRPACLANSGVRAAWIKSLLIRWSSARYGVT